MNDDDGGRRRALVKYAKMFSRGFWSLMSKPQYLVVIIGLIFGLLILILTPPFLAADEPSHAYNAFRISTGHILPTELDGWKGNYVPMGFIETYRVLGSKTMINTVANKETRAQIDKAFKIPLSRGYWPFVPTYFQYPPLCYVPQAVGMAIGHMLRAPPIMLIYLARLFNLLALLALAFLAIRITPVLKWTFFLIFLMPVALFQASSCSADAMTIAFTMLAAAYFFELAFDPAREKIEKWDYIWLFALAVALGLVKLPYLLVLFGFFLIPRRKFGGTRRYLFTFACLIIVACIFGLGWQFVLVGVPAHPHPGPYFHSQVFSEMLHHPFAFVGLEAHRLVSGGFYLKDMVGAVGWGNVVPPWWLTPLFLVAAAGTTLLDKVENIDIKYWRKLISLAVFLVVVGVVLTVQHLTQDPLGVTAASKDIMMGRYVIPPLAFGFLVFYNKSIHYVKGKLFYSIVTAMALLFCITTVVMIAGRFW